MNNFKTPFSEKIIADFFIFQNKNGYLFITMVNLSLY
jgi:hypothetical protein